MAFRHRFLISSLACGQGVSFTPFLEPFITQNNSKRLPFFKCQLLWDIIRYIFQGQGRLWETAENFWKTTCLMPLPSSHHDGWHCCGLRVTCAPSWIRSALSCNLSHPILSSRRTCSIQQNSGSSKRWLERWCIQAVNILAFCPVSWYHYSWIVWY